MQATIITPDDITYERFCESYYRMSFLICQIRVEFMRICVPTGILCWTIREYGFDCLTF